MKMKLLFLLFASYSIQWASAQKTKSFDVQSPDAHIKLHIETANKIVWSVKDKDQTIIEPSSISLQLQNEVLGNNAIVSSSKTEKVNNIITPIISSRRKIHSRSI